MRKKISRFLLYLAVVCLRRFLLILPLKVAMCVGGLLGLLGYYFDKKGRDIALENLKNAFPEKTPKEMKQICKLVYKTQGKNFTEFVSFPKFDTRRIKGTVIFYGTDVLEKAQKRGKGTIIITGHFGNWELLGAAISNLGYKLNTVARPFYISKINDIILKNRTLMGFSVIMRSTADSARDILRALKRNEFVGILIDQDTDVAGAFVKFFGRDAYTPIGPAMIASKTNCSVIYAFIIRNSDDTHTAYIEGPVEFVRTGNNENDIITNTQIYTQKIEEYIRKYPHLWVWFHNRWKRQKENQNSKKV